MNIAEKIAEFFLHARQTAEMLPDGTTLDGMPLPPLTSRPVQDNGPFAPQIVHMPSNLFICSSYNSTEQMSGCHTVYPVPSHIPRPDGTGLPVYDVPTHIPGSRGLSQVTNV